MPGFVRHLTSGVAVGFVGSIGVSILLFNEGCPLAVLPITWIFCTAAITTGAIYPDIDHPASIPGRRFTQLVGWSGAIGVLGVNILTFKLVFPLFQVVLGSPVAALGYLVVLLLAVTGAYVGMRRLWIEIRPAHRTITHSVHSNLVGGGIATLVLWAGFTWTTILTGCNGVLLVAVPSLLVVGALVHIALDRLM